MFAFLRDALRDSGKLLHDISHAHAKWEIETGRRILSKRKFFLLILLLPILLPLILNAASVVVDDLPSKIPILGGSKAYIPAIVNSKMFFGSIFVGLVAGLITGVIGAGGGYILTPALMSFGVRGIMAVGTDQFHLFAKAIMGTTIHRKMGNVNFPLAAWFVLGSLAGVTVGGMINRAIFQYSPALSDMVISLMYVVVLGVLGFYAMYDWISLRKSTKASADATTPFAKWLQSLPLKPCVKFDENSVDGGRKIPVYPVVICGLIVGFVAAIMGVGGGFLTFPMFVYGLGVSTFTTVGTDILQIIFTTCYSSIFQYAIYGFVFYSVSMGMLVGSLVGVQIGALVTKMVKGSQIRAFYALTIIAGFVNRAFALPRKLADLGYISLPRQASVALETAGTFLFFGIVGVFSLWILITFFNNVKAMRAASSGESSRSLVTNRKSFAIGVFGIVTFVVVLIAGLLPLFGQKTGLEKADELFNRLAKHSANYITSGRKQADSVTGVNVDIGVSPRELVDKSKLVAMLSLCGVESQMVEDGRVRLKGDFGRLAHVAINDAEQAFKNNFSELSTKYGIPAEEVLYCWWVVFDGLTRRFVQENRGKEANASKFMTSKILEPAYNFRGIEACPVKEKTLPVALLLSAYLIYTVWYGVSIMYVLEGLGVSISNSANKEEA
ncbi:MAG TPA: sulfite exporter TauE/SafE family protein [Victivallales bacterium]|nr:sulfite exporter TauE/SafE family protein [Victivallales bacterium]